MGKSLLLVVNLDVVRFHAGSGGAGGVDGRDFTVGGDRDFGGGEELVAFFESGDIVSSVFAFGGNGDRAARAHAGDGIVFAVKMDGESEGDGLVVGGHALEFVFEAVAIGFDGAGEALGRRSGMVLGFREIEFPGADKGGGLRLQRGGKDESYSSDHNEFPETHVVRPS